MTDSKVMVAKTKTKKNGKKKVAPKGGKGKHTSALPKAVSHGIGLWHHLKYFRDVIKDVFKYYGKQSQELFVSHMRQKRGFAVIAPRVPTKYTKLCEKVGMASFKEVEVVKDGKLVDVKLDRTERRNGFDWAEASGEFENPKQKEFDMKLATIKSELSSVIGMKPVKIHQYLSGTHVATVTTGVVNGIITIDASQWNEWSSLSALFDEYKVTGGNVKWVTTNTMPSPNTVNSMYVWCYDPTDGAALTSVAGGCEYAQHTVFALSGQTGITTVSIGSVSQFERGHPYDFHFKIPKDPMYGVATADEGMWLPTAAPLPFGYVKTYNVGNQVTAIAVTNWICQLDVEFRSRQ